MKIKVKKLNSDAQFPDYAKPGDAGFDLRAASDVEIPANWTGTIPTGLAFAVPEGYEMQIRMRSGASLKTPLIVANAPGTVDSGYRGEVKIIVRNLSNTPYFVKKGQAVAQGVICPVIRAEFSLFAELPASERGDGGFGSTGD